ncbi:hypothetical protein DSO57_1006315 [Entomophthora muscae]|uniref:Uncharacterized protein n=1 Tax=Entomophthora muscae TaxID=34485 RepID=A0ACC2T811_9FUNG|nr:hypothetical protein DSO57_1006315 [Entomophthora muscae]
MEFGRVYAFILALNCIENFTPNIYLRSSNRTPNQLSRQCQLPSIIILRPIISKIASRTYPGELSDN